MNYYHLVDFAKRITRYFMLVPVFSDILVNTKITFPSTKQCSALEKLHSWKVDFADDQIINFGDMVDGLVQGEPKDELRYAILMRKLFALNGRFHEAIKTYKGNVDIPFGFREQRQRLDEVHQFVADNKKYFSQHEH